MAENPFRIYIKMLEATLARQNEQIQNWPSQVSAFERRIGQMEAGNYTLYMENEDLKKQIKVLKAINNKRKSRWKPKVIHGPWQK